MKYFDPHKKIHSKLSVFVTKSIFLIIFVYNKYLLRKKIYVYDPWISISFGRVEHLNWGDDINYFFLRKITKDCLLPYKFKCYPFGEYVFPWLRKETIYSTIGSVFQSLKKEDSVVWGSGILNETFSVSIRPKKILAVRGVLTRNHLLNKNIACPEVYGDPALLLPFYYSPRIRKQYKLGIVPHYVDYEKEELSKFYKKDNVRVIRISGYGKWTDVIDQICSCEFVVSSSLHGLIVAHSYGIPAMWVEIKEPIVGDISRRFKFYDYYSSVGINNVVPFVINKETTTDDLEEKIVELNHKISFSVRNLVESCPFKLKTPRKNFY